MNAEKIARAISAGTVNPFLTCMAIVVITAIGLVSK